MHHHVPVAEIVEVLYHHVSIPKPEPSELKEFRAFWKKTGGDNHIISGEYAFGSTTPGTLYKQWVAIRHFVIMTATDAILDHGAATGIVLFGKSFFSPFPNMRAMGQEVDEEIFKKLEQNLKKYPLSNTTVKKGDSKYRKDWAPASIVIAFEGAPITWIQPHHKTITLNLFKTLNLDISADHDACQTTPSLTSNRQTKLREGGGGNSAGVVGGGWGQSNAFYNVYLPLAHIPIKSWQNTNATFR